MYTHTHGVCKPLCRGRVDGGRRGRHHNASTHTPTIPICCHAVSPLSLSLSLPFLSLIHVCLHRTLRYIGTGGPCNARTSHAYTWIILPASPAQKIHKLSSFTSISSAVASSVASCRLSYAPVLCIATSSRCAPRRLSSTRQPSTRTQALGSRFHRPRTVGRRLCQRLALCQRCKFQIDLQTRLVKN